MRKMLLAAALSLLPIVGAACSKSESSPPGQKADAKVPNMTVDELDKELAAKTAVPVDCNGDRTRKKMGSVPGSIVVTDEETYAESELPADKATRLVFY